MLSSMTGMGIGEARQNEIKVTVDIRSVNNRYLEMGCKVPSSLNGYEQKVREIIRDHFSRGKFYLNINIQNEGPLTQSLRVVPERVQAIRQLLNELHQSSGVEEKPTLDHFLTFSEMFDVAENGHEADVIWPVVQNALNQAISQLKHMRVREGENLEKDIRVRLENILKGVNHIEEISQVSIPGMHQSMRKRVQQLLDDHSLSEDRIYTEIAIMTDKLDVTEECVRMRSHYALFLKTLNESSVVGKKLNFLLQEMNREVNTISSKALNAEISHHVVTLKEEIEKIREQVQNLE